MHIHHHDNEHVQHRHGNQPISQEDSAVCPVMQIATSKQQAIKDNLVRDFNGRSYYLCCSGCATSFDENPQQYDSDSPQD